VHVVVVDHHRGGDGREQPSDHRIPPRLPVEPRVLLVVGHLFARRLARVAPGANELARLRRTLVDVDLVSEQQQDVGPGLPRPSPELVREGVESVELAAVLVIVLRQRVGRSMWQRDTAGAKPDPNRPAPRQRADRAGRELGRQRRPAGLAVQGDLVLVGLPGLEILDHDQRVVMSLHTEGLLPGSELGPARRAHLHGARGIGLHPDGRLGLPDVAQHGSEDQVRHPTPGYPLGLARMRPLPCEESRRAAILARWAAT
jgi:hypothetical protein